MKMRWTAALILVFCVMLSSAAAEVSLRAEPAEAQVGAVVDVAVEAGPDAVSVTYSLDLDGSSVFRGKEDAHFTAAFRPRKEGRYTLTAEVKYADGSKDSASASVTAAGMAEETQGPEKIYSQKDGWWKDKKYSKSDLDNAGCAIFTLSHALQRMGWTGEEIAPENLAAAHKNCYTENGTANARLIYNASQIYGYTTKNNLLKEASDIREALKNGDFFSFSIVTGHIALMTGIDEKAGKVRVADSAPSATFERIKKGSIYELRDGEYVEVKDPGEISGAKYYFETGYYGGLEYYLDLSYCARRGGRLIRPSWFFYNAPEGKIGASMVTLGSGECEITVADKKMTVPTRDLSWGDDGIARLAVVKGGKAVKMTNAEGKRTASIPGRTVLPVLRTEEDRVFILYKDTRGYVSADDVEITEPVSGEVKYGQLSVNGSTSGRATVKLRYGPSEKNRVAEEWKTGTRLLLLREEDGFWLAEAKGVQLWVDGKYVTAE